MIITIEGRQGEGKSRLALFVRGGTSASVVATEFHISTQHVRYVARHQGGVYGISE